MWAVALVALLGVAAAAPSSIQLKEATLLVQRPRQEGHAKNWNLEAQQHGQKVPWLAAAHQPAQGCPLNPKAETSPCGCRGGGALRRSGACPTSLILLPLTMQAQQAKLEAKKAEQEAIAAEKEFQAASDAEALAKDSVEAAAAEAAAADAKAARR